MFQETKVKEPFGFPGGFRGQGRGEDEEPLASPPGLLVTARLLSGLIYSTSSTFSVYLILESKMLAGFL